VLDTQHKLRFPEAEKVGGKLLWDAKNVDATEEDLLAQMDFPFVSVRWGLIASMRWILTKYVL
jgi:hypothetical protein